MHITHYHVCNATPWCSLIKQNGLMIMTLPARTGPKQCAPSLLRPCSFTLVPFCFSSLALMLLQRWNEGLLPSVGGQLQESRRIHRQEVQTTFMAVVVSLEYQIVYMGVVDGVRSTGCAIPCFVELITPPGKASKGKSCKGVSPFKWRSFGITLI